MTRILSLCSLIFTLSLLCSCTSVRSSDTASAPGERTGFLGSKKAQVEFQREEAFIGAQKVAIASFKIGYMEEGKAVAKAGTGFGGKSTAALKLVGIDDALRQEVTDEIYRHFVSELQANGYEVIDRQKLLASEHFQKAKTYESPYRKESSLIGSSNELTYFTPSSFGGKMFIWPSDGLGMGGIGWSNPSAAASQYADKHPEGVRVLNVTYIVDFANADVSGGRWSTYSGVQIAQGLSVRPGSVVGITGGHGGTFSKKIGSATLGQPVYTTESFAEVKDITSGAFKGVQIATNALSALTGGGTNQTRQFEIIADPQQYRSLCTDVLKQANTRLITAASSKR